jgi:hypothetical protein
MVALPDAAGPAASPAFSTADYARRMGRTAAAGAARTPRTPARSSQGSTSPDGSGCGSRTSSR